MYIITVLSLVLHVMNKPPPPLFSLLSGCRLKPVKTLVTGFTLAICVISYNVAILDAQFFGSIVQSGGDSSSYG